MALTGTDPDMISLPRLWGIDEYYRPERRPAYPGRKCNGRYIGRLNLTIGILAALHARTITGKGQRVDVALTDCVVASLEQAVQRYEVSGEIPERNGNAYAAIAPYDTYEAADGYVVIGCGNQKLFERFCCEIINRPEVIDDERFLTVPLRVKNNLMLKEIFEQWTKTKKSRRNCRHGSCKGNSSWPHLRFEGYCP